MKISEMSKKKKQKLPPCKHEKVKSEIGYQRRSDKPIDGYQTMEIKTCCTCNKQLSIYITNTKEKIDG